MVLRSERVEIPGLAPFQKSRVFLVDSGLASGGVAVSSGLSELVPLGVTPGVIRACQDLTIFLATRDSRQVVVWSERVLMQLRSRPLRTRVR